jgi:hypothetical protein
LPILAQVNDFRMSDKNEAAGAAAAAAVAAE